MNKKNIPPESSPIKIISENRKARFNYHLLEFFEAGMVLTGNEIKSIRGGHITLTESYVRPQNGELFLIGCHINEYKFSSDKEYNPARVRKLLLNKHDIIKLQNSVEMQSLTIVPVKIYLKRGRAKLEIALAKGKDAPDKRKTITEREGKKRAERAMKNNQR